MSINVCNNNSLSAITSIPDSITGSALNLISTQTASSSSTIDFTSGIDSTYDVYCFKYYNIHPSADGTHFQVNFRDGGSSFDATKTTSFFRTHAAEADNEAILGYRADSDLAQSTSVQRLGIFVGNDNDQNCCGEMHLFNPSSTTFVKHFIARTSNTYYVDYMQDEFIAGYCNVTAAIDGVQFSISSGTFDGVIKLYGIS